MFIEKHRSTYAFNKTIIGNSGGNVGKTIEKLDGNYLETKFSSHIMEVCFSVAHIKFEMLPS